MLNLNCRRYLVALVFYTYIIGICEYAIAKMFNTDFVFITLNAFNLFWLSVFFVMFITDEYMDTNTTSMLMNSENNQYFMSRKKYTPSPYKLYYMVQYNPELFRYYMTREKTKKRFIKYLCKS
jgi:hypothetical protein